MSQQNIELARALHARWNSGERPDPGEYCDPAIELDSPWCYRCYRCVRSAGGRWQRRQTGQGRNRGHKRRDQRGGPFRRGNIPNGSVVEQTVNCNAGERATGGGDQLWNGSDAGNSVVASSPVPNGQGETPTGWHVTWENKSGGTDTIHTYAICASP